MKNDLAERVAKRISAIDEEIAALTVEKEALRAAATGKPVNGVIVTAGRKAGKKAKKGKKGKANPNSPQAMAQYGRRYSEAVKAGDSKQAAEYAAKLNKTAYGKSKLKELKAKSGKPKAKKGKASVKEAAERLLDTK